MGLLEDKDELSFQVANTLPGSDDNELSDIWRKLLGVSADGSANDTAGIDRAMGNIAQSPVPVVADPWRELLHAQDVEIVDLQQCRPQRPPTVQVAFSEQEVEQALQILQEH